MALKLFIVSFFVVTILQASSQPLSSEAREWLEGFMTDRVVLVSGKVVREASPDQVNHMTSEVLKKFNPVPVHEMTRTDFLNLQTEVMELLQKKIHNMTVED